MGIRSFYRTLAGSWLTVTVRTETGEKLEGRHYVPPPTVRTALGLYAFIEGAACGLEQEAKRFEDLAREWLGDELGNTLFSSGVPFEIASRKVLELLSLGHEVPDEYEGDLEELEETARETSWKAIAADYAYHYKRNPLEEGWNYFLGQFAEIPRLRARDTFDSMQGYIATRGGEKTAELYDSIERAAFPEADHTRKGKYADFDWPEHMDDEWLARQVEAAAKLRESKKTQ